MPLEPLDAGSTAGHLSEHRTRFLISDFLVGHGAQEFSDPQSTRVAGRATRGKNVVRTDRLVTVGDAGPLAQEDRTVVAHPL